MGKIKAKDVAERMQLSISTIYKAFNGASDINDETRAAILETAAEMGYRGRPRFGNSKRLCVFIRRMEAPHVIYYLYEIMIAFKQTAEQFGYDVIICGLEDEERYSYNQIMEQSHYDGGLLLGLNDDSLFFKRLDTIAYPSVIVDNYIDNPLVSCITSDNLTGMNQVISHLIELGHKRIAFISGEANSLTTRERFAGYLNAVTLKGIPFDPELVRNGDFTEYSGGILAEELIAKNITAISSASDLMSIGAIRRLQSLGIRVPEDISVVGIDDIKLSSYITPRLTTSRFNIKDIGYRAFMCLRDLLDKKDSIHVVETPRFMLRDSTAPPAK